MEIQIPSKYLTSLFKIDLMQETSCLKNTNWEGEKILSLYTQGFNFLLKEKNESYMNVVVLKDLIQKVVQEHFQKKLSYAE